MRLTQAQRGLLRGGGGGLLLAALALLLFQLGSNVAGSAPTTNSDLLSPMPLPADYQVNDRNFDGPGPLVIPAAAFNLDGTTGSDYFFSFGGGYLQQTGAGTSCFSAPLYLPDLEPVTSMVAYVYDSSGASNLAIQLRRVPWGTFSSQVMGSVISSGSSGFQTLEDATISNPIVDQRDFLYYLTTCLAGNAGSTLRLYGVEINYGAPEGIFLPVVANLSSCPFTAESEPNDAFANADGPLCPGSSFSGNPNANGSAQDSDYFIFTVNGTGTIDVTVNNYLPSFAQVQLYFGTPTGSSLVAVQADQLSGTYTLSHPVTAGQTGTYYLRLVAADGHPTNTGTYNATVSFP